MNKTQQIGNLVTDGKFSTTSTDTGLFTFPLAFKKPFSDVTYFIDVEVWGNQATHCSKYLTKGDKIGVCGYLKTSSYETKDGTKRHSVVIVADEVHFLKVKAFANKEKESAEVECTEYSPDDEGQLPF